MKDYVKEGQKLSLYGVGPMIVFAYQLGHPDGCPEAYRREVASQSIRAGLCRLYETGEPLHLIACEHCWNAYEKMEMLDEELEKVLARRPELPMPNWRALKALMPDWDAIRKLYARGSMK